MKAVDKAWSLVLELKSVLVMVVVQAAFSGVNVFYKLAVSDGMNLRTMIAYRFIFASVFLFPLALIFERKGRKQLDRIVLFQAFLCGLFGGVLSQNLYLQSLSLTTATFASAMTNLIPGFTFVLAASLRMEKVGLKSQAGNAKVLGTLIGIGGAMFLTFYKGEKINIWPRHIDLLEHKNLSFQGHMGSSKHKTVLGALFALANCFCFALWLIIQAKMSARYPYPYSSTALMSLIGAILSAFFSFCVDKGWSQWKLGWNIRLLTVAYAGIVVSGLSFSLVTWCVRVRGPLFVSSFYPLMLVLSALFGPLLLGENLHLGSVIGSIFIICGLYMVLWGKGKEMKIMSEIVSSTNSGDEANVNITIASPTGDICQSNIDPYEGDHTNDKGANKCLPKGFELVK